MKYVERKKTPPAGIPPRVEPGDSFRDEGERSISTPLGRAVMKDLEGGFAFQFIFGNCRVFVKSERLDG